MVSPRLDKFFERMDGLELSLTFDDVRLSTGFSPMRPSEVVVESLFSRNVPVKTPIISAAMDTVTESKLAIELAKLGGLGIIHRNFSSEEQAEEVRIVKQHLHALIRKPITCFEDELIASILLELQTKGRTFHTLPVLNRENKLVGVVTENDFDLCADAQQAIKSIMSRDLITSTPACTTEEAYRTMIKNKKKVLPLVNNDRTVAGLYIFQDVRNIISGERNLFNVDSNGQLRVGAAMGVGEKELERAQLLVNAKVDVLVIDTAHGHTQQVLDTLKTLKQKFPHVDVVVGNISEPEAVNDLINAGADGIKVGQGPGSICTTRIIAGIGCPQVTAVYNCSKAARNTGVPVCADGGIAYSGDISIALAAGAHTVMLGSLLAGTNESPGDVTYIEGKSFKRIRGMGSLSAMKESKASRERYRQEQDEKKLVPEGIEGMVPTRGALNEVLTQYVGGLRAGMGYVGAKTIDELHQKASFRRITHAGQKESHPHDIHLIMEAPNYRRKR